MAILTLHLSLNLFNRYSWRCHKVIILISEQPLEKVCVSQRSCNSEGAKEPHSTRVPGLDVRLRRVRRPQGIVIRIVGFPLRQVCYCTYCRLVRLVTRLSIYISSVYVYLFLSSPSPATLLWDRQHTGCLMYVNGPHHTAAIYTLKLLEVPGP